LDSNSSSKCLLELETKYGNEVSAKFTFDADSDYYSDTVSRNGNFLYFLILFISHNISRRVSNNNFIRRLFKKKRRFNYKIYNTKRGCKRFK
jgi:hypothetical protein